MQRETNMSSILIVAFDGLQPAQVTAELMPNLSALAAGGVTFDRHHPVFPTVTRINAASMVTGRYPGGHGLAANTLVVREFDPYVAFSALEPVLTRVARKTGRVLLAPTLADILARHGGEYIAVGTGTSGNAYVHNPIAERSGGATIHPDFCLPRDLHSEIVGRFGPWPGNDAPVNPRLSHAVDIMTEYVLAERRPAVSLVWFCEPDHAQHAYGVGSETADGALREADRQFGRLLAWLDAEGTAGDTEVLVVSDHGYSTIRAVVDVEALVREAGFPSGESPGGVIVAPNGGSALFYVHDRDRATADRLASWLMAQPWCGAMVSSEAIEGLAGTLPARVIGCEGERAPELAVSMRWDSEPNEAGYSGRAFSTGGAAGLGQHGSMSPHEMKNVLFARGPSFKRGVVSGVPSGNLDLTPTILHVLGLSTDDPLDGRVLNEALDGGSAPEDLNWSSEIHQAERAVEKGTYSQEITVSTVGTTAYVDGGRASFA
jgi:arylsulfatase A-like enzyme